MKAYYEILDRLKTEALADDDVANVTYGDLEDVDLDKTSLYPLVHFGIGDASINEGHISFSVSILAMDIVSQYKEGDNEPSDVWIVNNQQDVLNKTLGILTRTIKRFQKGTPANDGIRISANEIACESFKDRFNDDVAGWIATFEITVISNQYFCDPSLYPTKTVWDFDAETLKIFFNRNLGSRDVASVIWVNDFDDTFLTAFVVNSAQASSVSNNVLTINYSGAISNDIAIDISSKNTWLSIFENLVTDAFDSSLTNGNYLTRRESLTHRVDPPKLVKYQWDQNARFAYLDFTEAVDIGNGSTADVSFYTAVGVLIGTFDLNVVLGSSGTRLELALEDELSTDQLSRLNDGNSYVEIAAGAVIADSDAEHVASTVGLGQTGNNLDTWVA